MDIDKILFGKISEATGISNSFTDLDINKDGKINEEDKNEATDSQIKSAIKILIDAADEEDELQLNTNWEEETAQDLSNNPDTNKTGQSTENINEEIKRLTDEITRLTKENESLILEYQQLQLEQERLQIQYTEKNHQYQEEQNRLDVYTTEYYDSQKEIEEINHQILLEEERTENDYKEHIENIINNTINSFDREKDGDFNTYFQRKLNEQGYPIFSKLNTLTEDSTLLSQKAQTVLNNITAQSNIVSGLKTSLNTINNDLDRITKRFSDINTQIGINNKQIEVNNAKLQELKNSVPSDQIKTQDEYNEILNNKYNELWEKFGGDSEKILQYVKDNFKTFMDIDGDGHVTYVDKTILDNYYNSLPKNGSAEWKEKGKDYCFTQKRAFYSITSKVGVICLSDTSYAYTLKDFENILSLNPENASGYIKTAFLRKLNISAVISEDNWSEKFNDIANQLGIPPQTTQLKTIQKQLDTAYRYAQTNPETKGYAGLAGAFLNYNSETETARRLQQRENEYYTNKSKPLYGADISNKYDWYMEKYYIQNLNFADINNDGLIDASDLANFNVNVDLDGDGIVSQDETTFLTNMKRVLENNVYTSAAKNGYNNLNSIDDVITYLENFNSPDYINTLIQTQKSYLENVIKGFKNTNTSAKEKYNFQVLNSLGCINIAENGYLDGTKTIFGSSSTMKLKLSNATPDEMTGYMQQVAEVSSPKNTYLHYIQNADLSKEELQKILSKINNASLTVQGELSNIKACIEQKLAAM